MHSTSASLIRQDQNWCADLSKSIENATNGGGVKEADWSQAQGSHGGVVDASAGLPPSQQVNDGPDGHQAHIPQTKANVAPQVPPSGVGCR